MSTLEDLARRVIGSWADGDLAGAVRDLDTYLREQDELRAAHEGTFQAAIANFEALQEYSFRHPDRKAIRMVLD